MANEFVDKFIQDLWESISGIRNKQLHLQELIQESQEKIDSLELSASKLESQFLELAGFPYSIDDKLIEDRDREIGSSKPKAEATTPAAVENEKVGKYNKNTTIKNKILYTVRKHISITLEDIIAYVLSKDDTVTKGQLASTYYTLVGKELNKPAHNKGETSINVNYKPKKKKK